MPAPSSPSPGRGIRSLFARPVRRTPDDRPEAQVLFVSRQRIVGRTNGSSAYLLDLAQATRRAGFTPHLVQPSPNLMGRWPAMRLRPEMAVFESHQVRGVIRVGRWIITRDPTVFFDALRGTISRWARRMGSMNSWFADRPRTYSIAAPWQDADRVFLRRNAGKADIVVADYAFQAEALGHLAGRRSAIVMHDLFHLRQPHGKDRDSVAGLDRESEIALLSQADAVIAIQAEEARFVVDNVPGITSILAPIAVHPVEAPQPGITGRLLFVGSNTAPNVVGLEWLFEHVWPLVRARAPQMHLDIAGTVTAAFPRGGPSGTSFHGLVDDLAPLYAKAAIIISPLTFGSGLKIKLVEALAHGKAVVATAVTLQGIESECVGALIQADDPVLFADAILELSDENRRLALGQRALTVARTHFSSEACHADFAAWLRSCGSETVGETAA